MTGTNSVDPAIQWEAVMDQFDPNIPGLIEGNVTSVVISDPQPFVHGTGNKVLDPTKSFDLTIEWELFGQIVPVWLAALAGDWDVSAYAESLGGGDEVRLGTVLVPSTATLPCTVNQAQVNCTKYTATLTVPPNTLDEHDPGTDQGGIYKLAVAVFLNSNLAGVPGYDLIGFSEGPIIQMENPV
jgi:hypothetical protein